MSRAVLETQEVYGDLRKDYIKFIQELLDAGADPLSVHQVYGMKISALALGQQSEVPEVIALFTQWKRDYQRGTREEISKHIGSARAQGSGSEGPVGIICECLGHPKLQAAAGAGAHAPGGIAAGAASAAVTEPEASEGD